MRESNRQVKVFSLIVVISLLLVTFFTCCQIKYPNCIFFAIINNISICVLTGGIVALVQSIIAVNHLKHNMLLDFYKDSCGFDDAVIHYASTTYGFSKADVVVEKVHSICTCFDCTVKSSFMMLDIENCNKGDLEYEAATILFNSFSRETRMYRTLENLLYEGIKFMKSSECGLCEVAIEDVNNKNSELNNMIQEAANKTVDSYNDKQALEKRTQAFQTLENYLFGHKHKKY